MYWRFDEEIQYVELDYPRDLQMWGQIPYNIDAVFQWHNRKTYFFKDKYFWEFDDDRMTASKNSPELIGEFWLKCPRAMQDPYKKARTSNGNQSYLNNPIALISVLIFLETNSMTVNKSVTSFSEML